MIAAVVLAGGQSKRMGSNKILLQIGGKTLLQHSKQIIKDTGIKNIFVSGIHGIPDNYINKGPLSGILSCMEHLSDFDHVFFLPVDMPLINKFVILKLISNKNDSICYFSDYVFPIIVCNNLINRRIIKQQLNNTNLSIHNMFEKVAALSIKSYFPGKVFLNANTEKEWQEILQVWNNQT